MKIFFIILFCVLISICVTNVNINAQYKIIEGFEGDVFPPEGWGLYNDQNPDSEWKISGLAAKYGNKCAVSNYSETYSKNYLVTKRFTPTTGDSLVFYFKQTFYNTYQDTLSVYISNADSLIPSMTNLLKKFYEGLNYQAYNVYLRAAISLNEYANQTVWISFVHSNQNGENIRIDEIIIGQPVFYEVSVSNNIFPKGLTGSCNYPYIVPRAEISNNGLNNISEPFNITYIISGPQNFSSTISDTISSGNSKTIFFDTVQINETGDYNVKIVSNLPNDQNRYNDTLYSGFSVIQSNYSGEILPDGNYYFANSSECSEGAVSKPEFCWKDTTGSINLINNGQISEQILFSGNINDGYFKLGNIIANNFKIKFIDRLFDSVFISTNGLIGFSENEILSSGEPSRINELISQSFPVVSPLWMNLDFGNPEVNTNRLCYKLLKNHLIITYSNAPLVNGNSEDYVSFQIVIETGNSLRDNSGILFQYNKESSGSGYINKYYNQELASHIIGLSNSPGNGFLFYRKHLNGITENSGTLLNNSLAVEFGNNPANLNSRCSQLQISAFLEARETTEDTISVSLAYSDIPNVKVETKNVLLINGTGITGFSLAEKMVNYYLIVEHKNSIRIWSSSNNLSFNTYEIIYDFTSDSASAYGDNLKMINGRAYMYTGDVNQDGSVEGSDLSLIDNNALNPGSVAYETDLNGDGVTDGTDMIHGDNNVRLNVVERRPY